jgi:hypothetical protein
MIETSAFLFGLGFSVFVYLTSIRRRDYPPLQKTIYTILSTVGITGMVWLCGVIIAHFLKKLGLFS